MTKRPSLKPKITARRRRSSAPPVPPSDENLPAEASAPGPFWAPRGADLQHMRPEVKEALVEAIQPLYQQFVLDAPGGMERWIGRTMVHLAWLESLQQLDESDQYINIDSVLGLRADVADHLDRCMRLGISKVKMARFLVQLRQFAEPSQTTPDPSATTIIVGASASPAAITGLPPIATIENPPELQVERGKNELC